MRNETEQDQFTVVTQNKPDYEFTLLVEQLVNSGVKSGLTDEMATQLAYKTVLGATHFLLVEKGGTVDLALSIKLQMFIKEYLDAHCSSQSE